jgi:two-component system sensor histidine kinase AlgZ
MPSIRQNAHSDVLPDFRNLGVIARLLVAVNAVAFVAELFAARDLVQGAERFAESATLLEPLLLGTVVALAALSPLLGRLAYPAGCMAVVAIVLALTAAGHAALFAVTGVTGDAAPLPDLGRALVLATLLTMALLGYFYLLAKAFSPALTEARLQALQARIRPHFLFNSLNTVLSLIRRDPKRAERALEDLSDLFRTLMSDARQFVRLADEIALLERYADLEQMRLGERLRVIWEIDAAPSDALLPPLVLQPLLENAIYHGVEPGTGPGEVLVRIERRGDLVLASIENPYIEEQQKRAGNRMALENIRERLMLFFDAEASIRTRAADSRFRVDIEIPYRSVARSTAASLATPTEQG